MSPNPFRYHQRSQPGFLRPGPFEDAIADYGHNLLACTELRRLGAAVMPRLAAVELVLTLARSAGAERGRAPPEDELLSPAKLRTRLRAYLRRSGAGAHPPRDAGAPVEENLRLLGELVGLDEAQRVLLQFLAALHASRELKEFTAAFGEMTVPGAAALIAAATSWPEESLARALQPGSRLIASGLVCVDDEDLFELPLKLTLKSGVLDALLSPGLDRTRLLSRFLPEAPTSTLTPEDLGEIVAPTRLARDLLAAALRQHRPGVNVLLYGETGTGKTAVARLIAQELSARLYVAGKADERGESANPHERLSSLALGQRLVGQGGALLLFDELEDLFHRAGPTIGGGRPRALATMSKQWFNDLLETNPIPTIWITNDASGIDPAFLRRFSYAIEFRPLGARQRARVLARHLGDDAALPTGELETIAARFEVSAAQLGTAVASARLLSPDGRPDRETIEHLLAPIEKVVAGAEPARRPHFDPTRFRLAALNASEDLASLAAQLEGWRPGAGPGVSLCLYGPPGTGKSEYVKYLAHRMGRAVVVRRASELLGSYVGETEAKIAEAFRRAEDDDAVLLFDEVDSFLRDRRGAERSWEVTQVNEFLQQLEAFRGLVACTTNLWGALDEASLRRFLVKVELRYATVAQLQVLFLGSFAAEHGPFEGAELAAVSAALGRVENLAPGDFALVARRARALGVRKTAGQLVAALLAEARMKPGARRAVGFWQAETPKREGRGAEGAPPGPT